METCTKLSLDASKIALGCAQLGTPYGVANVAGPPNELERLRLLQNCYESGLRTLDTATAYPNSEAIIGDSLSAEHSWHIVTKWIFSGKTRELFDASKRKLGVNPSTVLAHRTDQLIDFPEFRTFLIALREQGEIEKWGCSIYEPKELDQLLSLATPDVVQLPLNIFDQRAISSGLINRCAEQNIEIHVRSAFLQGALFLSFSEFQNRFPKHIQRYIRLCDIAVANQVSPAELSLLWLARIPEISKIVLGAETWGQMSQNLKTLSKNVSESIAESVLEISTVDGSLINPANWNLK